MDINSYEFELAVEDYAKKSKNIREMYEDFINTFLDTALIGNDEEEADFLDDEIKKYGDTPEIREEINEFIDDTFDFPHLPNNYPIKNWRKWLIDSYRKSYSFENFISNNWDDIEEEYLKECDDFYDRRLEECEDIIHDYVSKYDNIKYREEESHSWSKGRFPSIYFYFTRYKKDEDGDWIEDDYYSEVVLRFCDGHNNGNNSDYQIVFDEFTDNELLSILDDIVLSDLEAEEY